MRANGSHLFFMLLGILPVEPSSGSFSSQNAESSLWVRDSRQTGEGLQERAGAIERDQMGSVEAKEVHSH